MVRRKLQEPLAMLRGALHRKSFGLGLLGQLPQSGCGDHALCKKLRFSAAEMSLCYAGLDGAFASQREEPCLQQVPPNWATALGATSPATNVTLF